MIRYNNQIILEFRRNNQWQLKSDRGQVYDILLYDDLTTWWNTQAQTDIRTWQKDICVGETANAFGRLQLYNVYEKGRGYGQNHDICLVGSEQHGLWVLSTNHDYWICFNSGGVVTFDRKDSLGSILNPNDRQLIYQINDQLRQEYNPKYECRWVKY